MVSPFSLSQEEAVAAFILSLNELGLARLPFYGLLTTPPPNTLKSCLKSPPLISQRFLRLFFSVRAEPPLPIVLFSCRLGHFVGFIFSEGGCRSFCLRSDAGDLSDAGTLG